MWIDTKVLESNESSTWLQALHQNVKNWFLSNDIPQQSLFLGNGFNSRDFPGETKHAKCEIEKESSKFQECQEEKNVGKFFGFRMNEENPYLNLENPITRWHFLPIFLSVQNKQRKSNL